MSAAQTCPPPEAGPDRAPTAWPGPPGPRAAPVPQPSRPHARAGVARTGARGATLRTPAISSSLHPASSGRPDLRVDGGPKGNPETPPHGTGLDCRFGVGELSPETKVGSPRKLQVTLEKISPLTWSLVRVSKCECLCECWGECVCMCVCVGDPVCVFWGGLALESLGQKAAWAPHPL